MSTSEIILFIRKNLVWLLLLFIGVFATSVYLFKTKYFLYSSEVTIVADDVSPVESGTSEIEKYSLAKLNASNTARLYRQAYSDEMISFLDSALNLGEHYKIPKDEEYDSRLFLKIYKRLKITKVDFNITTIKFSDRNRHLTANVVNLVYDKLKQINREYIYSALKRKSFVYAGLIKRMRMENNNQVNELRTIFSSEDAQRLIDKNYEIKISILSSLAQIEQNNNSLKDAEQIVAWSTEAVADTSMQNIWLINKGRVPDAVFNWIKIIGTSFLIAVLFISGAIVAAYFFITNKHYIKLLLKG